MIVQNDELYKLLDYISSAVIPFKNGSNMVFNSGHTPFLDAHHEVAFNRVVDAKYSMPPTISHELENLLANLLQPNPTRRYGCLYHGVDDIR